MCSAIDIVLQLAPVEGVLRMKTITASSRNDYVRDVFFLYIYILFRAAVSTAASCAGMVGMIFLEYLEEVPI